MERISTLVYVGLKPDDVRAAKFLHGADCPFGIPYIYIRA